MCTKTLIGPDHKAPIVRRFHSGPKMGTIIPLILAGFELYCNNRGLIFWKTIKEALAVFWDSAVSILVLLDTQKLYWIGGRNLSIPRV